MNLKKKHASYYCRTDPCDRPEKQYRRYGRIKRISKKARHTDKPTIINMTNHSYFNLNGDPTQPITDNVLSYSAKSD